MFLKRDDLDLRYILPLLLDVDLKLPWKTPKKGVLRKLFLARLLALWERPGNCSWQVALSLQYIEDIIHPLCLAPKTVFGWEKNE